MPPPPQSLVEQYGGELSDFIPQVEIWPENWEIFRIFSQLSTQWRTGMGGATGLDYASVRWLLDLNGVEDVKAALSDIQVMEAAALRQMAEEV